MTPLNAIASIPPGAPGFDSGAARSARQAAPEAEAASGERSFWDRLWGKEGFSFGALLDVINPLQHIPVVATIYRAATGDTIGPAPRVIGGAIFGGVIGLITSAADAVVEGVTGKDTGSHILAMLPEPDPVSQWANADDDPRHRGLMTAVLNLPNDSPTQFASDSAPENTTTGAAAPTQTARETAMPQTAREAATPQAARDVTPALAAAAQSPAAMSPAAAQSFAPASAHPFAPPARAAQAGAGGRIVPLANNGRPVTKLPSPKELAANPALLQELRQGGASAANAAQKNTGRIDTAIKGHGLLAPGAAQSAPIMTPAAFNALSNPETRAPETGASDTAAKATKISAPPATRDISDIPEVGPDFLMKMQQALEKYQSMRTAPTVDVSR